MELFKLFGTIAVNNSEANQQIDETTNKASSAGDKIGSAFKKIGIVTAAAVTAATTACVALVKSAVESYAEYEQLVGGVETLFGTGGQSIEEYAASVGKTVEQVRGEYDALTQAQTTVFQNADNAYKSAGLSANEYMNTVTSFSAALISSLDGDSVKAAQVADMAVTDMADNANKMGTSMDSIQAAYQGFAKQNYTMLDNLKLGYGGTKTEMERLLADAEKITGIKYDITNLSDVYEAIHVIQTELGITGTTAKEAASTISGSAGTMKAAWKNMMVGIADDNANFGQLLNNLVESVATFAQNIIPRVEIALKGVAQLVEKLAPMIVERLPSLVNAILPSLLAAVSSILQAVVQVLAQLIPAVNQIVLSVAQMIIQNLPALIQAGVQLVVSLVQGIGQALPQLVPMAVQAVLTVVQGLVSQLPSLLQAGLTLIQGLVQGILQAIPSLIQALPPIITGIVQFIISAIPQIIQTGVQLLTSLVKNLPQIVNTIVAAIPQIINGIVQALLKGIPDIIKSGVDLITSLITNLPQIITTILTAIPEIISGIVNALTSNIPQIIQTGVKLLISLITNLPQIIAEIVKAMPQIIIGMVKALGEGVKSFADVGSNLIKGLWQGIKDAGAWLWDKISGFLGGIVNKIKGFFGIHSPSTVFAGIGKFLDEGLGMGIEENADEAIEPLNDLANRIKDTDFGTIVPSIDAKVQGINDWKPSVGGTMGAIESIRVNLEKAFKDEKDDLKERLDRLIDFLTMYLPIIATNRKVVLDSGVLVGELAPEMNAELNRIMEWKGGNRA